MTRLSTRLVLPAALCVALTGQVVAQERQAPQNQSQPNTDRLEEVVVTAQRRTETTQNVPMSIAAVTTATIDAEGLKTVQDLARAVPALTVPSSTAGGFGAGIGLNPPVIAIRGIAAGGSAPTTGIYIDDAPLQQRILPETEGGGGLLPSLFDLSRVEVLRGPQGTLYGGSSEGGTIRFITPQPDFEKLDAYVKGEFAHQDTGEPDSEVGARVSVPIIADRLAALVTVWHREEGGYIDHVSRFSGDSVGNDTNSAYHDLVHGALAWKATEALRVTLGMYYFDDVYRDSDAIWNNIPQYSAFLGPVTPGTPKGVAYSYGPYNFYGAYTTGMNANVGDKFYSNDAQVTPLLQPHTDYTRLPSLTVDWDFGPVSAKLASSYLDRFNHSQVSTAYTDISGVSCALFTPGGPFYQGSALNCGPTTSNFVATIPLYYGSLNSTGQVKAYTEELRFSSNTTDSPISWIGGLYFNRTTTFSNTNLPANFGDFVAGVAFGASTTTPAINVVSIQQHAIDKQYAAYGEVTYKIGGLHITGGVRWTQSDFDYVEFECAPLFGIAGPFCGAGAAAFTHGSLSERPITPKGGLQYLFSDNFNVYFNAAKGFRPGGVNESIAPSCDIIAHQLGLGSLPTSYGSDSLWSYELGSKWRTLNDRLSVTGSLFYINWNNVQAPLGLPQGNCGFTANAAKVVSQGADLDTSVILFSGMTVGLQLAYTDAKYKGDVFVSNEVFINDGDRVPNTPAWSGNFSAQYSFTALSVPSYLRMNYQFRSNITQGFGPGTADYAPDAYALPSTHFLTMRLGADFNNVDASFYVDNLTGSTDALSLASTSGTFGRTGCSNAACTSYLAYQPLGVMSTYRPRTFGIDVTYRY